MQLAKTNAGKFSLEITNNGEECGWLKQMWAADEKHDSNKQWPYIYIATYSYVITKHAAQSYSYSQEYVSKFSDGQANQLRCVHEFSGDY